MGRGSEKLNSGDASSTEIVMFTNDLNKVYHVSKISSNLNFQHVDSADFGFLGKKPRET